MRNVTNALLDEVRAAKNLPSDFALTKLLGVSRGVVGNYRTGRSQMSDEMALRVAKLLGRAPAAILAQIASERTKDPEVAQVWREAAKALARVKGGKRSSSSS